MTSHILGLLVLTSLACGASPPSSDAGQAGFGGTGGVGGATGGVGGTGNGSSGGGVGGGSGGTSSNGLVQTFLDFETNPSVSGSAVNSHLFIDATGKRHVAFSANRSQRYGECTTNCGSEQSWSFGFAGPSAHQTSMQLLAVEPSGAVTTLVEDGNSPYLWALSTCTANCTNETAWASTTFPTLFKQGFSNIDLFPVWGRPFAALNGRMAVLFGVDLLGSTDARIGSVLAYCPGACATENSWTLLRLRTSTRGTEQGEVVLTPGGGVRVAYTLRQAVAELHYAQCDSACENPANWFDVPLFTSAGSVSLAVTSTGQPRIAFYSGTAYSLGGALTYAECDGNCAVPASWSGVTLPGPSFGWNGVTLALDSSDTPYLAFATPAVDLSAIHCFANCATTAGRWTEVVLEDHASVSSSVPALLPVCTAPDRPVARWFPARNPSIALWQGRLAVSHDSQIVTQCGTGPVESGATLIRYDDAPLF